MAKLYIYGNRTAGLDGYPKDGFAGTETDPLDEYWNVLLYTRRLSDQECADGQLDRLGTRIEP